MAMVYTLVTSAKEWLSERYSQDASNEDIENEEAAKDDVWIPVFWFFSFLLAVFLLDLSENII